MRKVTTAELFVKLFLLLLLCWWWAPLALFIFLLDLANDRYNFTGIISSKIYSYFLRKVMGNFGSAVMQILSKNCEGESGEVCEAIVMGECMFIPFRHCGKEYQVAVPYNRRWNRGTLFETHGAGNVGKINFHPCLPVLLTPKKMGFEAISITEPTTFSSHIYKGNEVVLLPAERATSTRRNIESGN